MEDEILDILIEWMVGYRRGLLRWVQEMDGAIEKLTTLKESGESKVSVKVSPEVSKQIKIAGYIGDMGPDPKKCKHEYTDDACIKCGIFREVAEKADKPDK